MFKVNNKDTGLVLMSFLSTLHISHVLLVSRLLNLSWLMFARRRGMDEQNNFIALLFLLLILNIFHTLFHCFFR